jgi:hypothetical protein
MGSRPSVYIYICLDGVIDHQCCSRWSWLKNRRFHSAVHCHCKVSRVALGRPSVAVSAVFYESVALFVRGIVQLGSVLSLASSGWFVGGAVSLTDRFVAGSF